MMSGSASDPRPASSVPATSLAPSLRSNLRSLWPVLSATAAEDSSLLGSLCGNFRGLRLGNLARSDFLLGRCTSAARAVLAQFPNACLLPHLAAQVVELRAVHVAD